MKKNTPAHVAIIMDGNRRWAKRRGLSPTEGHRKGVDALIKVVEYAAGVGIKYLTFYTLSTENYKNRTREEIAGLLNLIEEGIKQHIPRLKKNGVKVNIFGEIGALPVVTRLAIKGAVKQLSGGKRATINLAINYGGRAEIIRAARRLAEKNLQFTEEEFEKGLYSADLPDPELVIRTGGRRRLSNFLIWQAAYSELYFTDTLWPDFDGGQLQKALKDYANQVRNFGR
ncbi:MAG TPA: polyprenyl diphosphate synthase [Candidatus Nanoarchaeia archaeon]